MVEAIAAAPMEHVLFLFHFSTRELHGVYAPSGAPGFPLHERAWVEGVWSASLLREVGGSGKQRTPFPAQLPVRRLGPPLPPLTEKLFAPHVKYIQGKKFELTLGSEQVEQLVSLLVAQARAAGGAAAAAPQARPSSSLSPRPPRGESRGGGGNDTSAARSPVEAQSRLMARAAFEQRQQKRAAPNPQGDVDRQARQKRFAR